MYVRVYYILNVLYVRSYVCIGNGDFNAVYTEGHGRGRGIKNRKKKKKQKTKRLSGLCVKTHDIITRFVVSNLYTYNTNAVCRFMSMKKEDEQKILKRNVPPIYIYIISYIYVEMATQNPTA